MSLEALTALAHEQYQLERELAEAELTVKRLKDAHRAISEGTLPALMDEMGVESFNTTDGLTITVKEDIRASISKPRAAEAFAWLRANGHDKLIRRTITTVPATDEQADEILDLLGQYPVDDQPKIHPQTLSAFVRAALADGDDLPLDLLGVYRQRISKVKV